MRVRGAVRRLCEYCYVVHRRGKVRVQGGSVRVCACCVM
jgi:ribosomal protein L36